MKGRIVGLNCGMYSVNCNGVIYNVPAKGIFRIQKCRPIVGDIVTLDEERIVISSLEERKNELIRPNIANVDQIIIVHSFKQPELSLELIFKFICYANINNIHCKVIISKSDFCSNENKINEIKNIFNKINIDCFVLSCKYSSSLDEIKNIFKNKVSCIIGQSGVGKSSLINALSPNFNREIGEYSYFLHRGKHKTKEVILLPFLNGFLADTPGFSSLDLNIYKEDLACFYPGICRFYNMCYYSNCLHLSEDKCAIKDAVKNGDIPEIIYTSYQKLISETKSRKDRYS